MIEMTEIRQLSDSDLQERIEVEREALEHWTQRLGLDPHR